MRSMLAAFFASPLVFATSPALGAPPPVEKLPFARSELPRGAMARGKVVHGLRWRDRKGENWLVMTRGERRKRLGPDREPRRSAFVYARHSVRSGKRLRRARQVRDHIKRCEADLTLRFLPKSFGITDLDGDGVGEVTFAYALGCRSDVSPITLKLLLLEGGKKYILRGTTRVKVSDSEHMGGKLRVDRSFSRGPSAFLDHARQLWRKLVNEH